MKTIILLSTIALALSACNQSQSTTNNDTEITPYPLDTCMISGEKLGSMGDPVVINYQGQEIQFCCASCKPKFLKSPDAYLAKLKSAPTAP